MSRILRRPMFRGGRVNSYGTGIASGLADGGRVGLFNGGISGGELFKKSKSNNPLGQDLGITSVNPFFNPRINVGTPRNYRKFERKITPLYDEFNKVRKFPLTDDDGTETAMTDATITKILTDKEVEEIRETASVKEGLPISVPSKKQKTDKNT